VFARSPVVRYTYDPFLSLPASTGRQPHQSGWQEMRSFQPWLDAVRRGRSCSSRNATKVCRPLTNVRPAITRRRRFSGGWARRHADPRFTCVHGKGIAAWRSTWPRWTLGSRCRAGHNLDHDIPRRTEPSRSPSRQIHSAFRHAAGAVNASRVLLSIKGGRTSDVDEPTTQVGWVGALGTAARGLSAPSAMRQAPAHDAHNSGSPIVLRWRLMQASRERPSIQSSLG
jgi:hypothetical protein